MLLKTHELKFTGKKTVKFTNFLWCLKTGEFKFTQQIAAVVQLACTAMPVYRTEPSQRGLEQGAPLGFFRCY